MGVYSLDVARKKDSDKDKTQTAEDIAKEHAPVNDEVVFIEDQNAALVDYRLTGVNRGYVDPLRAQEPDLAPEIDQLPGLGNFNPPPPDEMQKGGMITKEASSDPRTDLMEVKEERADDFFKAEEEANEAYESETTAERTQDVLTGEDVKDSDTSKSDSK